MNMVSYIIVLANRTISTYVNMYSYLECFFSLSYRPHRDLVIFHVCIMKGKNYKTRGEENGGTGDAIAPPAFSGLAYN